MLALLLACLFITACTTSASTELTSAPGDERVLTIMTHDSFSVSEEVLNAFFADHDFEVRFLKSGDTGTAVNKAILSKDQPLADVFYGIDNTFLSRALDEGIFTAYQSPLLSEIPDNFELDPQFRALPVDYGDVCLNYDKAYFEENNIPPPMNLEDLANPIYKGLLVVQNPATSSPGLAFLLATIGHYGELNYLEYWEKLVQNDLLVVNDWEIAYYQEFSRSGGERPIVVSYGSSPPFEVLYAEVPLDEPPTTAVVSDGSCFRQIEFVGILNGTPNRKMAEQWIDFMLSTDFQEDIPLQMFVFPVNENAALDEIFENHLAIAENPAYVSPDSIAKNRETWIQAWTEAVLR
jgi:thiamine transport system substrate-binding protein